MKRFFFVFTFFFTLVGTQLAHAYTDVSSKSFFYNAVQEISALGILKGYPDGTFKPFQEVTRAEFVKIGVLAKVGIHQVFTPAECFSDIHTVDWYSPYVCYAKSQGWIRGYENGSFLPNQSIRLTEVAKILSSVFQFQVQSAADAPWFQGPVEVLVGKNAIPVSVTDLNQVLRRGELTEMVWRILQEVTDKTSVTYEALAAPKVVVAACQNLGDDLPSTIDMARVRSAWLSWNNSVRVPMGLSAYSSNSQLARTAVIWSENAGKLGSITHKRPGQTLYYDYPRMVTWFKNLGLQFRNISGVTFTENINWGYYSCPSTEKDCTDAFIKAVRTGFDFFMSEKGKAYRPHYDSIVNKNFKIIGLGVAVDPVKKKYYLTVHYGTEIISSPQPICE